jgi:hypothetical protein
MDSAISMDLAMTINVKDGHSSRAVMEQIVWSALGNCFDNTLVS